MRLRAMVVDDEPLARSRIVRLLEQHEDVLVVGEARNGTEAVERVRQRQPDVVFLDVQMPDMNAFEVVASWGRTALPLVVFVTAYDEYALEAFDVHALDYLLKPFDRDRFDRALDLARQRLRQKNNEAFHARLLDLVREFKREPDRHMRTVSIKTQGRSVLLAVEELVWIESCGNYVTLHTCEGHYLHRMTMSAIAERLDPEYFVRVHRKAILNRSYVRKVRYAGRGRYRFVMSSDIELTSGRSYRAHVTRVVDAM